MLFLSALLVTVTLLFNRHDRTEVLWPLIALKVLKLLGSLPRYPLKFTKLPFYGQQRDVIGTLVHFEIMLLGCGRTGEVDL